MALENRQKRQRPAGEWHVFQHRVLGITDGNPHALLRLSLSTLPYATGMSHPWHRPALHYSKARSNSSVPSLSMCHNVPGTEGDVTCDWSANLKYSCVPPPKSPPWAHIQICIKVELTDTSQGLSVRSRLALNSQLFCFWVLRSGTTGVHHDGALCASWIPEVTLLAGS